MPSSTYSADQAIRDHLRELYMELEDAFNEWVSASTRIELEALALAGEQSWQAWFGIPKALIGSLRCIVTLLSTTTEPIPISWLQLRSEMTTTLQRMSQECIDWETSLESR